METRETKENIDTIKMGTQSMRSSLAKLVKEQEKTRELLTKLLKIEQERDKKEMFK